MKPPVEAISEGGQVARAVFGEIKRMIGPAEAGFEVTQDRVEPTELRHLVGFAQADDHGLVVTPGGRHPGKAG